MKKIFSLFSMTLLGGFILFNQVQISAQHNRVRGNGYVTKEVHDVKAFSALELSGSLNVYIKQGDKEIVTVETDENLHEYVVIENRGNSLFIDTQKRISIKKKSKMNVYVTVRDIDRFKISGVGNVETSGILRLKSLDLIIKSVGNVSLDLEAGNLDARLSSVGKITLSGKIGKAIIENTGVGKLAAYDLRNDVLKLKAAGVGKTEVYASKELAIKSTGVGNVYYKGSAVITDLNVRGIGKVKKR
jgi:hypothetical protein